MCVRHLTQFPFPLLLPFSPKRCSCLIITMFTQKHTSGHVHTHVHTRHTLTVTHAYGRMHISLEGMMLKLKFQYFGHFMRRVDSLEKTLMLGGIGAGGEGDDRGWDGWITSLTRWTWVWVSSGSWWWTGRPGVLRFMGSRRVGHNWATELNWTELMYLPVLFGAQEASNFYSHVSWNSYLVLNFVFYEVNIYFLIFYHHVVLCCACVAFKHKCVLSIYLLC